jgi:hypothetical protein
MKKRLSRRRQRKADRRINEKFKELASNHDVKKEDLLEEVVFVTKFGHRLKCFPVDEQIIEAKELELRKVFESDGISLEPPEIEIESVPGAANNILVLDKKEKCYVKDNQEETEMRMELYNDWSDIAIEFKSELKTLQSESLLVYGLGAEDYFGLEQEGGLELPDDFEKKFRPKIEALGHEWQDDYFWQMSIYLQNMVFRNDTSEVLKAIMYINNANSAGNISKQQFEEMMAVADSRFLGFLAESAQQRIAILKGSEETA